MVRMPRRSWQQAALGVAFSGTASALGCTASDEGGAAVGTSGAPSSEATGAATSSGAPGESGALTTAEATSGAPGSGPASSSGADVDTDAGIQFDVAGTPDLPGVDPRCQQNLDIVFVMDVSTTMGGFIEILSEQILAVDAAVAELDLLGEPHYGLAVFVDDAALLNDGNAYDDAVALQADFDTWAAFTASNSQVGGGNSNVTFTENSLDGLFLAASDFDWRPEGTTTRIIVHTTDDTFWDGPTVGNGVAIQHGYAETVAELQDQSIRVFAFADDIGGACECDDVTPGWSAPYMGMTAIPEATDGGVFAIGQILLGEVSLADAIDGAIDASYCNPYEPSG